MTLTTDVLCLLNHVHTEVQGKKRKKEKNKKTEQFWITKQAQWRHNEWTTSTLCTVPSFLYNSCYLLGHNGNNPLLSSCTCSWEKEYEVLPQYKGVVKSSGLSLAAQTPWIKMIDVITENIEWLGIAVYQVSEAVHCFAPASGLRNGKMKRAIFDFILSHQCKKPSWEATGSTKQS